jgi:hypothetical protein
MSCRTGKAAAAEEQLQSLQRRRAAEPGAGDATVEARGFR